MVVVGVDGSDGGVAALEFAAAEAALRKAELRIVAAWEVPAAVYGSGFTPPMDAGTLQAFGARAQQVADDAAQAVKKLQPALEVETRCAKGGTRCRPSPSAGPLSRVVRQESVAGWFTTTTGQVA